MTRPISLAVVFAVLVLSGPTLHAAGPTTAPVVRADGYRGTWYMNQTQKDEFKFKYSGGFATYPQQHIPLAIYSEKANKTFFVFGGRGAPLGEPPRLQNLISYYDHATGEVPKPVILVDRVGFDAHCNPTLSMDDSGYLYVFCNVHGQGKPTAADPLHGRSFIFRSLKPYSIDGFESVYESNFSYSQVWEIVGKGMVWLHTRYEGGQHWLFYAMSSPDGKTWSEPKRLMKMGVGGYQISASDGKRVATAADYHPKPGGLNARTNLYYLETRDFGQTWTTITGDKADLPLTDIANPALVHDYAAEGLLVYLKDLAFDADGQPVILYVTAKSHESGPASDPRIWHLAKWSGKQWMISDVMTADHNYDHGSLYIEPEGTWRIIAASDPGPQAGTTGGQIVVRVSSDKGKTWSVQTSYPTFDGHNATYVRRPANANVGFYSFWADGDTLNPSESSIYFGTKDNQIFRLPAKMTADMAKPELMSPPAQH